ncbi:MAG: hypothetical protein ACTSVZ_00865 [Promethearchaeota archaeon]
MVNTYLLDLGTAYTKFGNSTEETPLIVIPSAYGYPRIDSESKGRQLWFGTQLDSYQGVLHRESLFPWGTPKDFDIIKKFLEFCFRQHSEISKGQNLIIAISPDWSKDFLNSLITFLFQDFEFASIYAQRSDLFDFIGHKIRTGVLVNVGHYFTRVMLYHNGKPVLKNGAKSKLAGRSIRQYLRYLFKVKHPYLESSRYSTFLMDIVENKCDLKLDLREFLEKNTDPTTFQEALEIPQFHDTLLLGIERFIAPEILCSPELMNLNEKCPGDLLINSLKDCHPGLRVEIFKNIVISGGGSSYAYFLSRILNKCEKIPLLSNARLLKHSAPQFGVWKGMQIAANPSIFEKYGKTATQFFAKL